jgi:hypothetical protein
LPNFFRKNFKKAPSCQRKAVFLWDFTDKEKIMDRIKERAIRNIALRRYAMTGGTLMGAFWVLRFVAFLFGMSYPLVMGLFVLSVVGVPTLMVIFTRNYRDVLRGGEMSFREGLTLGILTCLYASLLAAAAHLIYFRFMDHGYVAGMYQQIFATLSAEPAGDQTALDSTFQEALDLWLSMSPIEITLQLMSNNIMWTWLMVIPIALFMRRKPKENIE